MSRDIEKLKQPFRDSIKLLIKRANDAGIPAFVTDTTRTVAEQRELVKKGYSQTMYSKHLTGDAADIAFTVNGKLSYKRDYYLELYEIAKDIPFIIWPYYDLKWFWDYPHYQYDKNKKGNTLTDMEKAEYEKKIRALNTEIGEVTRERDNYKKYKKEYRDEVRSHESTIDHLNGCKTELNRISGQKNKATELLRGFGDRIRNLFH